MGLASWALGRIRKPLGVGFKVRVIHNAYIDIHTHPGCFTMAILLMYILERT